MVRSVGYPLLVYCVPVGPGSSPSSSPPRKSPVAPKLLLARKLSPQGKSQAVRIHLAR